MTGKANKAKIVINTWITKTFLRKYYEEYVSQLIENSFVLKVAKTALDNVTREERNTGWGHYCGAYPRYWEIEINDNTIIYFTGGYAWKAKVDGNILYLDNCLEKEYLLDAINEGLKQINIVKEGKSLYKLINI